MRVLTTCALQALNSEQNRFTASFQRSAIVAVEDKVTNPSTVTLDHR